VGGCMRLIMIIALAVVTASLIGVALSFKTAATQIKTEAHAPNGTINGAVHVTVPEGMKALPAELVPVD
jgi:hypothetical protein